LYVGTTTSIFTRGHASVSALPDPETPSALALARYSVALGARALPRGPRAEAAWRMWMPLDVDRVRELPWVGDRIRAAAPGRVLDVASPKLLAAWLAERTPANVVGTDLWAAEIDAWRALLRAADPAGTRWRRLALEPADGTRLQYEDASFDAAYSASVIEHVPGDGDGVAMAELARVLRPGGVRALTFPYRREHEDEFVEHDLYGQRYTGTPIFFQRHYAADTVDSRLLASGAFDVLERGLWRKEGVKEAKGALARVVPARLELGRFLGPALGVIGARALTDAPVDQPGPDNVLRLLLRRV
jgi:SAM-dependent methyltransferase